MLLKRLLRGPLARTTFFAVTVALVNPVSARESLRKLPPTQNDYIRQQLDQKLKMTRSSEISPNQSPMDLPSRPYALPIGSERLRQSWLSSRSQSKTLRQSPCKAPLPSQPLSSSATLGALDNFVQLQRQLYPQANVISGFYDWRTTSRWRSRPGLHFGYDVAMPYGSPFVSGWEGVVTAIVPWSEAEVGIVVRLSNGYTVTYGHVASHVKVGDTVAVGQVVGQIRLDHVDVKMRDSLGNFVDFGNGQFQVPTGSLASRSGLPGETNERTLVKWFLAQSQLEATKSEIEELEQLALDRKQSYYESKLILQPLREEATLIKRLTEADPTLLQKRLLDSDRQALRNQQLQRLTSKAVEDLRELQKLEKSLIVLRNNAAAQEKEAQRCKKCATESGLAWSDVERMVALISLKTKNSRKASLASSSKSLQDRKALVSSLKTHQVELETRLDQFNIGRGAAGEEGQSSLRPPGVSNENQEDLAAYRHIVQQNLNTTKKRLRQMQNMTGDWFFEP